MKASDRLIKELKERINTYQLYKNFTSWKKEEFGLVDRLVEERKRFEIKHFGYYQPMMPGKKKNQK